ncbi:MAG: hypothetical protein OES32_03025 [Acidobacteriota bacterium]|nr:hypothetical protein [Acidobacteriota bacterium]
MNQKERIARIQKALGVTADGVIGPATLTAAELRLGFSMVKESGTGTLKRTRDALHSMTPSTKAVEMIVAFEVVGESYYTRRLAKPTWPGGRSGVTIGIGYDIGYNSASQIEADWGGRIPDAYVQDLKGVAGLKGSPARDAAKRLADVGLKVPFDVARSVFHEKTLSRYAKTTLKAYPGVDKLPADAQGGMLSLVYNRGASKSGASRKEMADLAPAIEAGNLETMADLVRRMKRLWVGKNLDGLLKRRDAEADLIENARHDYAPGDYLVV